jgi:uncharacterized Zn finger protein (UPF0148 family)
MSDFDREAEREKLREKYEKDKQKREASERMSELLLQGATMTNRHCPECHSPVFRYDGREFCPTCQKEVTEDGELLDPEDGAASTGESSDAGSETTDADAEAEPTAEGAAEAGGGASVDAGTDRAAESSVDAGDDSDPAPDAESDTETQRATDDAAASSPPAPARERSPARVDPPARRDRKRDDTERTRRPDDGGYTEASGSERDRLREAEATLVDEVESLTRRVGETRDVGRKRDLLAAAREAAETLEAVRRL